MTTLTIKNRLLSTHRTQKYRENMIRNGFKRIQKWVFNIESLTIQEQIKKDLANYKLTQEEKIWNDFAVHQLKNLEEWK